MDLGLSKDEIALQARARVFSQDVARPRAAAIDRDEQYPWDIVKALAEAGFCGMTIPKALGGQGRSFLDAVLVIEEMAKSCTVTARIMVETNMGAVSTVMAYGNEAQKKLAARLVLEGDKPAICITEPDAGSDALAMTTRADKRGDTYVVNGKKHWITGAGVSRLHLIFARMFDERGQELGIGGLLAVRDENKGLRVGRREQTMGLRGMPEGELLFEDLEVPAEMAIMPPSGLSRGFADLMNAYNSQRVGAGGDAHRHGAGADALAVIGVHQIGEAPTEAGWRHDRHLRRHFQILEQQLAFRHAAQSHGLLASPHAQALVFIAHGKQATDAEFLPAFVEHPRKNQMQARDAGTGNPMLLAVDDVFIAAFDGARGHGERRQT